MVQEVGRHLCLSMGGTCGTSHGTADRGSSRTIDNCWNTTCARLLITPMSHSKHQWITNKPQWKARRTKRSRLPMSKNRSRKIYTSIRVKIKINSTSPWPAAGIVAVEMGVLTKISEYKRVSECQWSALSSKMVLHLAMPLVGMCRDPMHHMPYIASRYFTVEHVVHGVLAHAWPNLDEAPFWSWSLSLAIVHQAYHWPTIGLPLNHIRSVLQGGWKLERSVSISSELQLYTTKCQVDCRRRRVAVLELILLYRRRKLGERVSSMGPGLRIIIKSWMRWCRYQRRFLSVLDAIRWQNHARRFQPLLTRPSPTSSLRWTSSFTRARGPPVLKINTLADHS